MSMKGQFHVHSELNIGVFKPSGGLIDEAIDLLCFLSECLHESRCYNHAFILKSLHGNAVVWGTSWVSGFDLEKALTHLTKILPNHIPSIEALRQVFGSYGAAMSPCKFSVYCLETRSSPSESGKVIGNLREGLYVSTGLYITRCEDQERLAYGFLALSKSYLREMKGLEWFACMKSLDGDKVVCLFVWEDLKSAYQSFVDTPSSCKLFLEDLVLSRKMDLFKVAHAPHLNLPWLFCMH